MDSLHSQNEALNSGDEPNEKVYVDVSYFSGIKGHLMIGLDVATLRRGFELNSLGKGVGSILVAKAKHQSEYKLSSLVGICRLLNDSVLSDNTLMILVGSAFDICDYLYDHDYDYFLAASHVMYVGIALLFKRERSREVALHILERAYDDGQENGASILIDLWNFSVKKYHWTAWETAYIVKTNKHFLSAYNYILDSLVMHNKAGRGRHI